MEPTNRMGRGRPSCPQIRAATDPAAEALAKGTMLWRAAQALRPVENWLELEAADPRIATLQLQARELRVAIAGVIVEVAAEAVDRSGNGS